MRADHLGCYGYDKPTSPTIDALCEESAVFEKAIAHASSTLPSHASILTSLLPHHHGASWENRRALPENITTLPEVVRQAGYSAAAFTGGGQLDPIFGLTQGFDPYEVLPSDALGPTARRGLEWLDSLDGDPFLLFLHTYQVHHPYDPSPDALAVFEESYDGPFPDSISVETIKAINRTDQALPASDLAHVIATYDAEILEVDRVLAGFFAELKARDLWDSSLIVLTSDHGEEFGEHGFVGWHSHTLYEELLEVPLIIKFPGGQFAGRRVDRLVRGIDIAPTILKAIGSRVPPEFSGIDLTALWSGREVPPLLAVSRLDRVDQARVSSIRDERFKLLRPFSRRQRLFDLAEDPDELWDASGNHPLEVGRLLETFEEILATREAPSATEVDPSPELRRQLEALGYIQ